MAKFEPHATYTDAELLELVKAAIATITVAGQSYQIRGRTFTQADLKDLMALRDDLEHKAAGDTGVASFGLRFTKLVPPGGG